MYTNAFKVLSKKIRKVLGTDTLSEAQVIAAKLHNFLTVNAATASLPTLSGKITQKDFLSNENLPEEFIFEKITNNYPYKITSLYHYDNDWGGFLAQLVQVSNAIDIDIEERVDYYSILINGSEFLLDSVVYLEDEGFTLNVSSGSQALRDANYPTSIDMGFSEAISLSWFDESKKERVINLNVHDIKGSYSKVLSANQDTVQLLRFNSELLEAVSDSPQVLMNKKAKLMASNFMISTYQDLIEMSDGIIDQPFLLSGFHEMSESSCNQELELENLFSCNGLSLVDNVITIRTSLDEYCDSLSCLSWNQLIEMLRDQPEYLKREPIRFLIDFEDVVPIGILPRFKCGGTGCGLKIVKPKKIKK